MRAISLILSLVLLSTSMAGCFGGDEHEDHHSHHFNGLTYDNPAPSPEFTLTDQNGDAVSLSDFDDKVVVVAFTYTSCVDVCLTIEANLDYIEGEMSDESDLVLLSITIDPDRDTPEHLLEWTSERGYDWTHLTSENHTVLAEVWDSYHLLVDSDHINSDHTDHVDHSNMSHQVAVLYPDNSSVLLDGHHNMLPEENATGWNLTESTMSMSNISLNYSVHQTYGHSITGINGVDSPPDSSWWWSLHIWNATSMAWEESQVGVDEVMIMHDTNHIAWAASNANLSLLPIPSGDVGVGGEQGSGDGHDSHDGIDEEEEMYQVGHNTVTFIIDKEGNKRVAYTGSDWLPSDFIEDLEYLLEEGITVEH